MTKVQLVLPITLEHKYGKIRATPGELTDLQSFLLNAITGSLGGKPNKPKSSVKKGMSPAQRAALSKRMKAVWAKKREAK
jgi:hypothetical protein